MSETSTASAGPARYLARDIRSGIVVFFVAIPLCLGIAIASGAPPLSGLIAGMVGGLVVAWASGSQLSVSGPAAGLTAIVLGVIESYGYGGLLLATALAGVFQIALGLLRMGVIGAFVPSGVIKGMLAGIGLILIGTQIPLALGHGASTEAGLTTPDALLAGVSPLAVAITLVCLAILVLFETPWVKNRPSLSVLPAPLIAVLVGVAMSLGARVFDIGMTLSPAQHVQLPGLTGPQAFFDALQLPSFGHLTTPGIYIAAATIALVASLETLLSVEAVDEMDPLGRTSDTHRELKAQGLGNLVSGLIGGLPMTAVIVRSSANVQAGGRTRLASFIHGILLLVSVAFLAFALETIPLAALAAILLFTGYKLARPALIAAQYRAGWRRFLPFAATIVAILATDLLIGVLTGIAVALYFLVRAHHGGAMQSTHHGDHVLLRLNSEVSFLNRQDLRDRLARVAPGGHLIIDGSANRFMDPDIQEDIDHFISGAPGRGITVELRGLARHTATYTEAEGGRLMASPAA
ncbi:SulP family inorganic anion transporter [Salinisphaera sp. Q1T1-3]|uniref:SulP family inorganic anion transporter n=1 Tax=Salinisphaera sp. Q1T1-3 TaxID=2321229 RepID=UPI000E7126EE|nr:SulP family inorganic anion transporter [Salinisphaera sp. Q1T1-3]RJS91637.1 SulP family inorganic anion transporter [Salinisphaera sp. Q1T1-3]